MEQIRAFIAIELPPDVKTALKNIQTKLKQAGNQAVKWVEFANIHLTLKFLGNISSAQIELVTSAMQAAAQSSGPFRLQVQAPGAFPNLNRVQVIWIGLTGDLDHLAILQKSLDSNLAKLGFPPENKPFSPHLTLGRVRETATLADKQTIGKSISTFTIEPGMIFDVLSLNLMQSRLSSAGPTYTRLKSVELAPLRQ
jgi:RNA 2',3'-cyclic 3'-phosphodiesterase